MDSQIAMLAPIPPIVATVVDSWWAGYVTGTALVVILLIIIAYLLRRLVVAFDKVAELATETNVSVKVNKQEMIGHIDNDAIHCKGAACVRGG